MAFQCTIVTPESMSFDQSVTQAILPTFDGLLGVLTNHAAMLVKLGMGPLTADLAGGKRVRLLIDGGVAQMKDNKLTILTDSALDADKIDAAAVRSELAEAEARPHTDPIAARRRQTDIARAKAKLELAAR